MKTIFWVALLMILFIYVCAILMTILVGKNDPVYDPYYKESAPGSGDCPAVSLIR